MTSPLDDIDEDELAAQRLSLRALKSAKAFADGSKDEAVAAARDLKPEVAAFREGAGEPSPSVNRALSDAMLDIEWVISEGKLPTSVRLHHYLRDR